VKPKPDEKAPAGTVRIAAAADDGDGRSVRDIAVRVIQAAA
jgi:hypothetical protein